MRKLVMWTALLVALNSPPGHAENGIPDGFDGSALVALSDGAMLASGYIDGLLGPREADSLTILPLENGGGTVTVPVTNSVATWPNTMALSPNGDFAIIAEPFAQPAEHETIFSAIVRGQSLTVVDVSDRLSPRIVQIIDAPGTPAAVAVHPNGRTVAVTLPFDGQIALYPFADGQLGTPVVQELGLDMVSNTFVPEFKWRPDGEFAAVSLGGADRVAFYRFDGGELTPWGPPLRTAPLPGMGRWTADGNHFIITTITATGDMAQVGYGQNASLFGVFRFDATADPDTLPRRANDRSTSYESPAIQHARIAHVLGGMGYVESFALSPDGFYLAAANMVASWLPDGHPGRSDYSEVALFRIDPQAGLLHAVTTRRLPGVILPQGITFDRDGSHLAVTSFQHDGQEGGSISFFELSRTAGEVSIDPVGDRIKMPRGIHDLKLLP